MEAAALLVAQKHAHRAELRVYASAGRNGPRRALLPHLHRRVHTPGGEASIRKDRHVTVVPRIERRPDDQKISSQQDDGTGTK